MDIVGTNTELCEALGLDPADVKEVLIRLTTKAPPQVVVTYSARYMERHPELVGVLRQYWLKDEA